MASRRRYKRDKETLETCKNQKLTRQKTRLQFILRDRARDASTRRDLINRVPRVLVLSAVSRTRV